MKYLDYTSPNAFNDISKRTPQNSNVVECPVCHGFGMWNLRLDAYGPGKHFQCSCFQCNGWGYVERNSKDASCIHEYRELTQQESRDKGITHFGRCYHVYECKKCGNYTATDSSD